VAVKWISESLQTAGVRNCDIRPKRPPGGTPVKRPFTDLIETRLNGFRLNFCGVGEPVGPSSLLASCILMLRCSTETYAGYGIARFDDAPA